MISRIIRNPLRQSLSFFHSQQFCKILKAKSQTIQKDINVVENELQTIMPKDINFSNQVDGKKLILRSLFRNNSYCKEDLIGTVFSLGAVISFISNMSYISTLACTLGFVASVLSKKNIYQNKAKQIVLIEVSQDQKLHILTSQNNIFKTTIVDKKDFIYNTTALERYGGNTLIWCKINQEEYWISSQRLEINNLQMHHLL